MFDVWRQLGKDRLEDLGDDLDGPHVAYAVFGVGGGIPVTVAPMQVVALPRLEADQFCGTLELPFALPAVQLLNGPNVAFAAAGPAGDPPGIVRPMEVVALPRLQHDLPVVHLLNGPLVADAGIVSGDPLGVVGPMQVVARPRLYLDLLPGVLTAALGKVKQRQGGGPRRRMARFSRARLT